MTDQPPPAAPDIVDRLRDEASGQRAAFSMGIDAPAVCPITLNAAADEIARLRDYIDHAQRTLNAALSASENVSDQTPRTQDVANTTDGLDRLSASVLFVLFWLLCFFIGFGSVDILLRNPDYRKWISVREKMNSGGGKPEGYFTERQYQCVPASESSVLTKN